MQVAEQRIQLAEARRRQLPLRMVRSSTFLRIWSGKKMSAEGLMGPFALNDPAAGTTGPWYTNGTLA